MMKKETKNNDGPSCACGKVDLYEERLKNDNKKKEISDKTASRQIEDIK